MKSCPEIIKAAYMVGKWLLNDNSVSNDENVPSSYALKMATLLSMVEEEQITRLKRHVDSNFNNINFRELTFWLQKIFRRLLDFALLDYFPMFFCPTFHLPVWKGQDAPYYTRDQLRHRGIDQKQWIHSEKSLSQLPIILSYLVYWSLLDEGTDIDVECCTDSNKISDSKVKEAVKRDNYK